MVREQFLSGDSVQVLLVQDTSSETDQLRSLLGKLTEPNVDLIHAENLDIAFDLLKSKSPDLILIDTNLNDATGLKGLEQLQAHRPELPFILLGDKHTEDLALAALRRGAQDYLIREDLNQFSFGRVIKYAVERMRFEANLRENSERTVNSKRLETVGKMAGGIAHDFNNLLMIVMGRSELMQMRMKKDSRLVEGLAEIQKAATRAASLTRKLLAFSRRQVIQTQPVQINTLIEDFNKILNSLLGENIELVLKLNSDLERINADPRQLDEILMNLALNARDAMPTGGMLVIETSNVVLDESFAANHLEVNAGHYALLSINDSGIGMDADTCCRAFEPFFSTKEFGSGTGMGLTSVYEIIKEFQGTIWLESDVEQGTTVKIYLPQTAENTEENEVFSRAGEIKTGSPKTILVVEDESSIRGLLTEILGNLGYRILEAEHGAQALTKYAEVEDQIDLLITDLIMPKLGGRELAVELKKSRPTLKVLFMSGYTDNASKMQGLLDANSEFIQKPFSPKVLVRLVQRTLSSSIPS